ncbi:MAG TPA: protein kinase [Candidatus Aquilonibacter sp.]|jgi:serine/threonine protein kinase|nr:protein kinase [Candidatus Aquilonibacter sp.]
MALTSGTKLGPYEIQSPLGAGGMGEVYRAKDTRLDRIVAIKILSTHLSENPEIKQRFEREARAISALNHPNICHLYDIGSQDGTDFLVMEFLEGETLADRLRKGAMPLGEILKVGIAVAEALAFAHRNGIVHRDLKPGNIMLTPGGAKLMDFGLAKPLSAQTAGVSSTSAPSFTAAATMSGPSPLTPLTMAGSIVGTIQYMSPEQIEGKEADARSDIFALGAVLYEMAAGKRPFSGKSQISLASSILENDPEPIRASKPQIPLSFENVVTTCLQKNPEERFQSAQDLKLQLQWIAKEKPATASASDAVTTTPRNRRLAWAFAALMLILGIAAGIFLHPASPPAPAIRTVINSPEKTSFNLAGDFAGPPVLSPDGTSIVFSTTSAEGKSSLWVRAMNSLEARPLADTDGAYFPFWSPDSRSIGFFAPGKLKTIELNGSAAQEVCSAPYGRGGAWGANGIIVFSPTPAAPMMRVSATGGSPVDVTTIDTSQHTSHRWPFFLPDGKHFLYLAIHHEPAKAANDILYYASTDGKENHALFRAQSNAVYADGFLLFARGDQLMAQPFDPASGKLNGEARVLSKNVMNDPATWHMDASAADNGLLIYGSGGSSDWQLIWIDRDGKKTTTVADKLANLQSAVLSPQGDRIATGIDVGENDIWVLDLQRGVRTRLTFGPIANANPVWSPDGQWIAYASVRNNAGNIFRKRSDGSGAEELLVSGPVSTSVDGLRPNSWSNDGKELFYSKLLEAPKSEVWALPLEGDRKPHLVLAHGAMAKISPNGHWLAYASLESGTPEVYVEAYGGGQGKWQVSNGGQQPQWSHDGKQLYYMDLTFNVFSVPVKENGGALQFGAPQMMVGTTNWSAPQAFYDVTPDGSKFLLNRIVQQVAQSVTVVTNFSAELRKPGGRN